MISLHGRVDIFNKKGSRGKREPFFNSYGLHRPENAPAGSRLSAVGLILYERDGHLTFPLIQRTIYDGVHSGQIALPGGKVDKLDNDLLDTAIRESKEEIGIHLSREMHSQQLLPIYIPPSNMHVHPYCFMFNEKPIFQKEEREVHDIIEVRLQDFLDLSPGYSSVVVGNKTIDVPSYIIDKHIIWGATALILSEFRNNFK